MGAGQKCIPSEGICCDNESLCTSEHGVCTPIPKPNRRPEQQAQPQAKQQAKAQVQPQTQPSNAVPPYSFRPVTAEPQRNPFAAIPVPPEGLGGVSITDMKVGGRAATADIPRTPSVKLPRVG